MANEEQATDQAEEIDYLSLSDEEILNMPEPSDTPAEEDNTEVVEDNQEESEEIVDEVTETEEIEEETESNEAESSEVEEDAATAESDEDESEISDESEENQDETEENAEKESEIDYKGEYERLIAPFRANGKEIQVKNVDEAITLMQMGANYNKKMAALKPNLKMLKMLENNQLLSEEKLNFLVDLDKKNPEAIKKLIKDSGLDPLNIDLEGEETYKPNTYQVNDKEIELDQVLDEIQGTASYAQTLDIVSKEWDGDSRQIIANQPQILKILNEQVENGIYGIISKEMESARALGRLNGLSDIAAYKQIGDAIQARGGFDHVGKPQQQSAPPPKQVIKPKSKATDTNKLKEKKRAAAPTKAKPSKKTNEDFNPLSMSDEEFAKSFDENLY